jgi:hypothetical protein
MKEKKEFKIGDKWYVNEKSYRATIRQIQGAIPLINDLSDLYKSLSFGDMTEAVFLNITKSGLDGVVETYRQVELEKVSNPLLQAAILPGIQEKGKTLALKLKPLLTFQELIDRKMFPQPFFWSDFGFVGGMASIKTDEIRERYTYYIENDKQISMLTELEAIKFHWARATKIARENGYTTGLNSLLGEDNFFSENSDATLEIEPMGITYIR